MCLLLRSSCSQPARLRLPDLITGRSEWKSTSTSLPAVVWAKVGHYCDISRWLAVDCKIVAGGDDIGTVRSLANGRVLEIMVGKTDLSYGYTQPAKAGAFYNLYHGYVEAKPLTRGTSRILYTLFYDVSDKPDEAAKQADMAQRRQRFEAALKKMKEIAER